ncbi:hypothetical protein DSO57_1028123 [Entomophthora muscae]|uniref:Uncharacterized protein n=1 Tax=Entomophthora muscae TaxID=34485 RepID=A0ACC2RG80_9FUNG|nr:hypothetical protein DSO57_1028123 [Entomophthora muscae]
MEGTLKKENSPEKTYDNLVPDRVLIRDRFSGEWLFPSLVYYVFEGEDIPTSIPKDASILTELGHNSKEIKSLSSFSPHFLAYDATFVSPLSSKKEEDGLVPEEAISKTLSTLVIDGAYSNTLSRNRFTSTEKPVNQLLVDYQEGKASLAEAIDNLETSFSHRNRTLQSILDLEASDYQKVDSNHS